MIGRWCDLTRTKKMCCEEFLLCAIHTVNSVHINFCLLFGQRFLSTVSLECMSVVDGVLDGTACRVVLGFVQTDLLKHDR